MNQTIQFDRSLDPLLAIRDDRAQSLISTKLTETEAHNLSKYSDIDHAPLFVAIKQAGVTTGALHATAREWEFDRVEWTQHGSPVYVYIHLATRKTLALAVIRNDDGTARIEPAVYHPQHLQKWWLHPSQFVTNFYMEAVRG